MSSERETDMSSPLEDVQRAEIRKNNERLHSLGIRSLVREVDAFKRVPVPTTRKKVVYPTETFSLETSIDK
jgi:hypothetical protein